jgi:hypothetical protein
MFLAHMGTAMWKLSGGNALALYPQEKFVMRGTRVPEAGRATKRNLAR